MERHDAPVVVEAVGVVSALGEGAELFARGVREGVRAERALFCATDRGGCLYAPVPGFDPRSAVPRRKMLKVMPPAAVLCLAAAREVLDSGLLPADPARIGISVGARMWPSPTDEIVGSLSVSTGEDGTFSHLRHGREGVEHIAPLSMLKTLPNMCSSHLSIVYGVDGPTDSPVSGEIAGIHAVLQGVEALRAGEVDVFVAGAADSWVDPFSIGLLVRLGRYMPGADDDPVPSEGAVLFRLRLADAGSGDAGGGESGVPLASIEDWGECFVGPAPAEEGLAHLEELAGSLLGDGGVDAIRVCPCGVPSLDRAVGEHMSVLAERHGIGMRSAAVPELCGYCGAAQAALELAAVLLDGGLRRTLFVSWNDEGAVTMLKLTDAGGAKEGA